MTDLYDSHDWYWYQYQWDKKYDHRLNHIFEPYQYPCVVKTEIRLEKDKLVAIHKFGDLL